MRKPIFYLLIVVFASVTGVSAASADLITYFETNVIRDLGGENEQRIDKVDTAPHSYSFPGYAQLHHTYNQIAAEATVDGWVAGRSNYQFSIHNASNPALVGTAIIGFSGSAFAAANNGYARAVGYVSVYDAANLTWGEWYMSEADAEAGNFFSSTGGTGTEVINYSYSKTLTYNALYRFDFSAHAVALNNDTAWARAWIDPIITLPNDVAMEIALVPDNPDFPTILMPTDDNPGGAFLPPGGQTPVPVPATMLLLASGLVGLAGFRRRFRKSEG